MVTDVVWVLGICMVRRMDYEINTIFNGFSNVY